MLKSIWRWFFGGDNSPSTPVKDQPTNNRMVIGTEFSDWNGVCPDCGGVGWYEGPSGGLCVNVTCANEACGTKLNVAQMQDNMMAQRI